MPYGLTHGNYLISSGNWLSPVIWLCFNRFQDWSVILQYSSAWDFAGWDQEYLPDFESSSAIAAKMVWFPISFQCVCIYIDMYIYTHWWSNYCYPNISIYFFFKLYIALWYSDSLDCFLEFWVFDTTYQLMMAKSWRASVLHYFGKLNFLT